MRILLLVSIALLSASPVAAQRANTYGRTANDPLVAIINQVPSFAGMWIDSVGYFHGSLTNQADSTRLRAVLEGYAAERRSHGLQSHGVKIDKADYSYAQLYEWQCKVEGRGVGIDGFQGIGVDERFNRVHVGVYRSDAIEKVRSLVKSIGIPLDAMRVELEGKLTF